MPSIRENLLELIKAVEACPDDVLDLNSWGEIADTACGMHYCLGGLLTVTPFFTAQGIYAAQGCWAPMIGVRRLFVTLDGDRDAGDAFFGEESFLQVFAQRNHGVWDLQLTQDIWEDDNLVYKHPIDKMLALARLQRQLALYTL